MARPWTRAAALALAVAALAPVSACKVVSIEEDRALRARRNADLDAPAFVDGVWARQVTPELQRRTVPAEKLLPAIDADLDQTGARLGRRAGEGAAWTFVISGEGRVVAVDRASRRGTATVALDGVTPSRTVELQIGPVVSGTAVRDALPFIAFNDFSDQLAFADVGRALTDRAMAGVKPRLEALRPGDRVRFAGVYNVRRASDPLLITPFAVTPAETQG